MPANPGTEIEGQKRPDLDKLKNVNWKNPLDLSEFVFIPSPTDPTHLFVLLIPSSCTCIPQACLAPGVTQENLASFETLRDVPKKYLLSP